MRGILVLTFGLALAWMAWWIVGSTALERSIAQWFEDRRAEGRRADYADLYVEGFPSRFDTRITDLFVVDPASGFGWNAPTFSILQLSYMPTRAVVVLPPSHTLILPNGILTFQSSRTRGSVSLRPVPDLDLDRATFVLDDLVLSSNMGWAAEVSEGRLAIEALPADNTYRLGAEFLELSPEGALAAILDPGGIQPAELDRLRLDATVTLTAPLDRHAGQGTPPCITAIDLADLSAVWGDVRLQAGGALTVDEAGVPEGEIVVVAQDWRRVLDMAVSTGLLADTFLPAIETALDTMAGMTGDPDTLEAPLTFRNGRMSFGPLPLGRAPALVAN